MSVQLSNETRRDTSYMKGGRLDEDNVCPSRRGEGGSRRGLCLIRDDECGEAVNTGRQNKQTHH